MDTLFRNKRICKKCTKHEIGDEFHYILNCPSLQKKNHQYLSASYTKIKNTISFKHIMSNSKHCFSKKIMFIYYDNK